MIRYVLILNLGGMYCDLEYEFLRPYDYTDKELLLATEFDTDFGNGKT